MRGMKISDLRPEPWRDIALDAMKRGDDIWKRNGFEMMDANAAMLLGLSDIIREMKEEKEAKP